MRKHMIASALTVSVLMSEAGNAVKFVNDSDEEIFFSLTPNTYASAYTKVLGPKTQIEESLNYWFEALERAATAVKLTQTLDSAARKTQETSINWISGDSLPVQLPQMNEAILRFDGEKLTFTIPSAS